MLWYEKLKTKKGRAWGYTGLSAFLLFLLVLEPLIPTKGLLNVLIWEAAFLLVVLAALSSAVARPRTIVMLVLLGLLSEVLAAASVVLDDDNVLYLISAGVRIAFLAAMSFFILRHVFLGGEITSDKVLGAVCVYLLLGMTFGFAFSIVGALDEGAFAIPAHLQQSMGTVREAHSVYAYFSMTTITTLGYGDVTPVHPVARSIAMIEAAVGQLYIAIVIAGLVGVRITTGAKRSNGDASD